MLSVGAIRFEDWFCGSRKGRTGVGGWDRGRRVGGSTTLADCAWWLLQLGIEKAWSALDGPLFCFLVQTGIENGPFTL